MSQVVILSGSPSKRSRSERVLSYLGSLLEQNQCTVTHLSVRDVPQEVLVGAKFDSPAIEHLVSTIQQAQGVIVSSPVYKASYSGVLKALIDLLPQDILEHKPILPLMTGGSPAHLLAIEYTLKPLLASLKGQNLKGIYFQDSQINREAAIPINDEELLRRTMKQIDFFIDKLVSRNHHSLLHL